MMATLCDYSKVSLAKPVPMIFHRRGKYVRAYQIDSRARISNDTLRCDYYIIIIIIIINIIIIIIIIISLYKMYLFIPCISFLEICKYCLSVRWKISFQNVDGRIEDFILIMYAILSSRWIRFTDGIHIQKADAILTHCWVGEGVI